MKMVIDYNPFITETAITINGKEIAQDNVLFSISKYTLQCWLSPNGSWPGLLQILTKISRGERIELVFRGRMADYEDFKGVFNHNALNMPAIEIRRESAYEKEASAEMLDKCLRELKSHFKIDFKLQSNNINYSESVKIINSENIQNSIDYLADNSNIYIFIVENINDERCIDLIAQALQGNNFYHSPESTVLAVNNNEKLSIKDAQALLKNKGIKLAYIIPYDEKISGGFSIKNIAGASGPNARLEYLYQKYIQPRAVFKDVVQVLASIEKIAVEMRNIESIEKEYIATCKEINTLQAKTLSRNDASLLTSLVEKNNILLGRINYLKDKRNQNKINEIAESLRNIFGISEVK